MEVFSADVNKDEKILVLGATDCVIAISIEELNNWKICYNHKLFNNKGKKVNCVKFSPDLDLIAAASSESRKYFIFNNYINYIFLIIFHFHNIDCFI